MYFSDCLYMKDLGPLKYFLGIEVARNPIRIFLSQRKYVLDIISEAGLFGAKLAIFPLEPTHQLTLAKGPYFFLSWEILTTCRQINLSFCYKARVVLFGSFAFSIYAAAAGATLGSNSVSSSLSER